MRIRIIIIFTFFALLIYPTFGVESREYHFIFKDTTGICTFIIKNGERIAIKYHGNSDRRNLDLFLALKWHVLNPNAEKDNQRIVVIGKLLKKVNVDPKDPSRENYQEFELYDWYLKKPFRQILYGKIDPDEFMKTHDFPEKDDISTIERDALAVNDFRETKMKYPISSFDLTRFVK